MGVGQHGMLTGRVNQQAGPLGFQVPRIPVSRRVGKVPWPRAQLERGEGKANTRRPCPPVYLYSQLQVRGASSWDSPRGSGCLLIGDGRTASVNGPVVRKGRTTRLPHPSGSPFAGVQAAAIAAVDGMGEARELLRVRAWAWAWAWQWQPGQRNVMAM